jgi:hypothetical protein
MDPPRGSASSSPTIRNVWRRSSSRKIVTWEPHGRVSRLRLRNRTRNALREIARIPCGQFQGATTLVRVLYRLRGLERPGVARSVEFGARLTKSQGGIGVEGDQEVMLRKAD